MTTRNPSSTAREWASLRPARPVSWLRPSEEATRTRLAPIRSGRQFFDGNAAAQPAGLSPKGINMADTKTSLTGRGAWRLLGASSLVLALAACSGLPTAPTQPVRYDLAWPTWPRRPRMQPPLGGAGASGAGRSPGSGPARGLTAMFYRLNYSDSQQLRAYQNALEPASCPDGGAASAHASGAGAPRAFGQGQCPPPVGRQALDCAAARDGGRVHQVFDNASNSRALLRLSASLIGVGESAGNQLLGQKVFTVEVPAASAGRRRCPGHGTRGG
jgi:cholesterol transport system auxiliary component